MEIRIEVPQIDTSDKTVLDERESYIILGEYLQYKYDFDVLELQDDILLPPKEKRWVYDARVLKSNITGCNLKKIYDKSFSFYGVAIWYIEGSTELLFEKHTVAKEVMEKIWNWIKTSDL